jgi:hypothetical protein
MFSVISTDKPLLGLCPCLQEGLSGYSGNIDTTTDFTRDRVVAKWDIATPITGLTIFLSVA